MPLTVGVIAERDGKILVVYNKFAGKYRIITGFVEGGESPEQAAFRELIEETGFEGKVGPVLGVYQVGKKAPHRVVVYLIISDSLRQFHSGTEDCKWVELASILNEETDPGFLRIYNEYEKVLSGQQS